MMRQTILLLTITFLALSFLTSPEALAQSYYKYKDKDGKVNITDSINQVPAEYRDQVDGYTPPVPKGPPKEKEVSDLSKMDLSDYMDDPDAEPELTAEEEAKQFVEEYFRKWAGALMLLSVLFLASWIWLVLQGFKTSATWGLLNFLFSPLSTVLFGILNFEKAKVPLAIHVVSLLLLAAILGNFMVQGMALTQSGM